MADVETLRTTLERDAKAVELKPSMGQATGVTKVSLRDLTTCDIEEDGWKLTADVPTEMGGNNAGPGPTTFGRAALGSCLAIGCAFQAALHDVPIENLEIEVETDIDARGLFGLGDIPPGWSAIRYKVKVESPAPEAEVQKVLDAAHALSTVTDNFTRAFTIEREVEIRGPGGES